MCAHAKLNQPKPAPPSTHLHPVTVPTPSACASLQVLLVFLLQPQIQSHFFMFVATPSLSVMPFLFLTGTSLAHAQQSTPIHG
jgi:hypothetical protein